MSTELAKAYVQILPSARGMKDNLTKVLDNEMPSGEPAGEKLGGSLVGGIRKIVVSAGIGKLIRSTLEEGAALEQSVGGVETLFKKSSGTVIKNAEKAYKTAGLSANDYMETVTSFSATLLQGLGGDTVKAADIADKAIIAMSDNSNKFGTDMRSVMTAYQGFAKQNYTMLDNLKLGYGGTQAEMARLINDSGVLGDAIKVNADTVKDVPFDKIIEAIGIIQDDLGVTGTTAKEAASTFSGSMASMRASVKNLLGAIASGNGVEAATDAFISTAETFLSKNFVPMLSRVMNSAGKFIKETIKNAPEFLSELVKELDFDSAATLFAALSAPKAAKKLLSVFKTDPDTMGSLRRSGEAIGGTIGDSTAGTAEGTAGSFTQKFSKGLSAASSLISAAIVGWNIGTMIYNCAKPGIDKITDALVNAAHAEEDARLNDEMAKADQKWRIVDYQQRGAWWINTSDWNNQAAIDNAAFILGEAEKYKSFGVTVDDVYYSLSNPGGDSTSHRKYRAAQEGKTWGSDLSKGFAKGISDNRGSVTKAAVSTAGAVKSVLGFSEPEEGPLSDFHTYAPDMMQLFARGISDNRHLVENEVVSMMSSVRGTMTEPVEFSGSEAGRVETQQKTIVLMLTDSAGMVIAKGTVEDIDELQGASVMLGERGLAI